MTYLPAPFRRALVLGLFVLVALSGYAQAPHKARARRFLQGRGVARALAAARVEQARMMAEPRTATLSAAWTAVGPGQVLSKTYGAMTGRVSALAFDPADATGNTVYLGATGGGLWKSTNAAGTATFAPLTDTLPVFSGNAGSAATASLSIGAIALANGVLLAGTGDANDATDSYYGSGLLRSIDGGVTFTLVQGSVDGAAGNHSWSGLAFAGLAFSSANPSLVVAAVSSSAEGNVVNAADAANSVKGLYYSSDAGVTWHMASIYDGSQPVQVPQVSGGNQGGNAATAVVWNGMRQRFYAAVRFHGYYESADGMTWTRLVHQSASSLTLAACPTNPGGLGSAGCPLFRGALAVQSGSGDLFALTVDSADVDQGLAQDVCGLSGTACTSATVMFGTQLASAPLDGAGKVIAQADYNLALAAAASGTDTLLYVGTEDVYRCSLQNGCALRNTTNAANGCTNPAGVAPAQHALAVLGTLVLVGNDGGLYRSSDGVAEMGAACSVNDASHWQNLNDGLGSLAEVVSFAQDPVDPETLLAGLGALGSAGTGAASGLWPQVSTGEGGTVAIDQGTPANWYVSTGAGVEIGRCTKGAGCGLGDFVTTVGAAQVAGDLSAIDAPWLIDPQQEANVVVGTCRVWRGPDAGAAGWSGANALSRPFSATGTTACGSGDGVVRSLGVGGAAGAAGSEVMYVGLAGVNDGGQGVGGHVFVQTSAQLATSASVWTDAAKSSVTNDVADAGVFNPGGFDVSSVAVDPHDATGKTVYVTVMGFQNNGVNAPHVYRSLDAGAHWQNVNANLPNAPANAVAIDPNDANTVYVATDVGVFVTTEVANCGTGNCWSAYGTGLPNAPVTGLAAAAGMATGDGRTGELRAATYGRGIWEIPLVTAIAPQAPGIAVSPNSLVFAAQQAGTLSVTQTVTVTNTGNAALVISSITATGDFTETDNCLAAPVVQGGVCTVQVMFLPAAAGARTGLLTVYGNVPGGQATVALSGTGTAAAALVFTPGVLAFPATGVGSASVAMNVTLSNTGSAAAAIGAASVAGDFAISADTCGTSLGAQSGCTISLVFSPTAAGNRTAVLTQVDAAGTQTVALTGTGTAPATDLLSATALSFPATQLTTASAGQTVTLTNAGDVPLTLISAAVTAGNFTVVNACGNSLNGHSSCSLVVGFAPRTLGAQTGTISVSDAFRTQVITVNGLGVAGPGVSLAPLGGLVFGATPLGVASVAQTVTLTNNGGVPLVLSGVSATGDFAVQAGTNTCVGTVAPGGACGFGVVLMPTVAGARTGVLTVGSNAVSGAQTLALSGTGVDFSLTVNGSSSATLASGGTASYALLLSSPAGVPGVVAFACAGVPAHASCTVNPVGPALGVSTPVTVTVATGLSTAVVRRETSVLWVGLVPVGLLVFGRRRWRGLLAAMVLVAMVGCGASRVIPGSGTAGTGPVFTTPAGSYNLVVTGSSAGLARTVNLTLVVQ